MRNVGACLMIACLIALVLVAAIGMTPASMEVETQPACYLQFDDAVPGPSQAEITCNCGTFLESKDICNQWNYMDRSASEEWCSSHRSAAGVINEIVGRHFMNSTYNQRDAIERFRCLQAFDYLNSTGRFTGAPA